MSSSTNDSDYEGYPYYSNVLSFERNHDYKNTHLWMEKNYVVAVYVSAVYLTLVYALERYMRDKSPVDVRKIFFWWNVALSIFSTCGMLRGIPEVAYVLRNYGFEFSVCHSKFNAVSGFWVTAFVFSKVVELFETVFLILRKKLSFIHLVHHVLTLLIVWFCIIDQPGFGRWVGTMNFTVHAFMYAYFALKASNINVPESVSFSVTSLQLLQFIIGFVTSSYSAYALILGHKCSTSIQVAVSAMFINGYFFYIFGRFYVRRYFQAKPKSKVQ